MNCPLLLLARLVLVLSAVPCWASSCEPSIARTIATIEAVAADRIDGTVVSVGPMDETFDKLIVNDSMGRAWWLLTLNGRAPEAGIPQPGAEVVAFLRAPKTPLGPNQTVSVPAMGILAKQVVEGCTDAVDKMIIAAERAGEESRWCTLGKNRRWARAASKRRADHLLALIKREYAIAPLRLVDLMYCDVGRVPTKFRSIQNGPFGIHRLGGIRTIADVLMLYLNATQTPGILGPDLPHNDDDVRKLRLAWSLHLTR